jgi:hypothetical protein
MGLEHRFRCDGTSFADPLTAGITIDIAAVLLSGQYRSKSDFTRSKGDAVG